MQFVHWQIIFIEDNNELVKKYFVMAAEQNDAQAMVKLGCHYQFTRDYDSMKKILPDGDK